MGREWEGDAPEDLHVDLGLEDDEEVCVVVRVNLGARVAQVFRTVRAVEPLASDVRHAPVTHRERVRERAEVVCGRTGRGMAQRVSCLCSSGDRDATYPWGRRG